MAERAGSSTSIACCRIKTAGRSRRKERPTLHRCFSLGCVRLGTPLIFLLLIFQPVVPSHIPQVFFWLTVQNQLCIRQRVVIDQVVQFCLLRHGNIQRIFDLGATSHHTQNVQLVRFRKKVSSLLCTKSQLFRKFF